MNKLEQRTAIAEADGKHLYRDNYFSEDQWCCICKKPYKDTIHCNNIDYLNDLNAMHQVEKKLSAMGELVRQNYLDNLCIVANGETAEMDGSYKEVWTMCQATAGQRAEAFLRTIGKWRDE